MSVSAVPGKKLNQQNKTNKTKPKTKPNKIKTNKQTLGEVVKWPDI